MSLEFTGYLGTGAERRSFVLRLLGPERHEEGGDYFVTIDAPAVLTRVERIFGVDENQARQLAARYLLEHLAGRPIYDTEGRPVDLRELLSRT